MLDESTGVTPEVSATSAGSESPVVPQTTESAVDNSTASGVQPQATVDSTAPPAADEIPENDDDLASLTETERTPLINQRNRIRELNKKWSGAEPIVSLVEQRGGMDNVRSDLEMLDKLFSDNPQERQQGYAAFLQDSAVYDRFMTDIKADPMVRQEVLDSIEPQTLLRYMEQSGLLPQSYGSIDPSTLGIPAELQEVWRSHPPEVQDQYAEMSQQLRDWHLKRDAQLYNTQKAERQREQQAQQQQQQQRAQASYQQKTKIYNDVRSIVQQSLAEVFPGNEQAINFALSATETALYQSPEGAALWNELEGLIDSGQTRGLREKLPLIIAKAKAVATQQATWLNERESKARQFDELMRKASQDEILAYVNQMRGGMKQPSQGTTVQPGNGHVPSPEKVGQYANENILAYHPLHQRRS